MPYQSHWSKILQSIVWNNNWKHMITLTTHFPQTNLSHLSHVSIVLFPLHNFRTLSIFCLCSIIDFQFLINPIARQLLRTSCAIPKWNENCKLVFQSHNCRDCLHWYQLNLGLYKMLEHATYDLQRLHCTSLRPNLEYLIRN